MIIHVQGILRSAGQQLPNQEIILEATRTAAEVVSTTEYSFLTDQQGNYSQQIQTGTYVLYVKQNLQSTRRQVASNIIVLASMDNYSINQILLEQGSIEIIDEDLLEQVLNAKNEQLQQASVASAQSGTAVAQSNSAISQANTASSQANTASSQATTALAQSSTATAQATQAQQQATSAQNDAQSIQGQADLAIAQQEQASNDQAQAQVSQNQQLDNQNASAQSATIQSQAQASQHSDQSQQSASAQQQQQDSATQQSNQAQAGQDQQQQLSSQNAQQQSAQQQDTQQTNASTNAQDAQNSATQQNNSSTSAQQSQQSQLLSKNTQQQDQSQQHNSQQSQSTSQTTAQQDQQSQSQSSQSQQASQSQQEQDKIIQVQQSDTQTTQQTTQVNKQALQSQSELKQKAWASQPANEAVEDSFSQYHFQKLQEYYAGQSIGSAVGQLIWRGGWSAQQGNYPPTPNDTQDFYRITEQGTIQGNYFQLGDYLHWDVINLVWFKLDGSDQVVSVNGKTGAVVVTPTDIGALGQTDTQLKQYQLESGATIQITGDVVQGQVLFDGKESTVLQASLAEIPGLLPGTYTQVTVNAKGRVTQTHSPSTLQEYNITDATPSTHMGSGGQSHSIASELLQGFMSSQDFIKLSGVADNQNNYVHPTTEGSKHVPQISQPYDISKVLMVTEFGSQWKFISQQDVTDLTTDLQALVPKQTTINQKPLTQDIILGPSDVGQVQSTEFQAHIDQQNQAQHQISNITGLAQQLSNKVSTTTKINGKQLAQDITLTQEDLSIPVTYQVISATFTYGPSTGNLDTMQELLDNQSTRNTSFNYDQSGTLLNSISELGTIRTTTTYSYDQSGNLLGLSVQEENI